MYIYIYIYIFGFSSCIHLHRTGISIVFDICCVFLIAFCFSFDLFLFSSVFIRGNVFAHVFPRAKQQTHARLALRKLFWPLCSGAKITQMFGRGQGELLFAFLIPTISHHLITRKSNTEQNP